MIRTLALLALIGAAFCAPINSFDEIPAEYKDLIPEEVATHLKELTDADKEAMKAVAMNYKEYKTEEEAFEALKAKSPETHEKVMKVHKLVQDRINALGDDAKAFATEVITAGRKLHAQVLAGEKPNIATLKETANSYIAKFKALSDDAKADFQKQFPIITSVIKNEKFQQIAKTFLGAEN